MTSDRHLEKRERILAAARELFLRQGLRATSMEAIARGAGMAKPTLYAEFADKDAVFLAILEQLVADFPELGDECVAIGREVLHP